MGIRKTFLLSNSKHSIMFILTTQQEGSHKK